LENELCEEKSGNPGVDVNVKSRQYKQEQVNVAGEAEINRFRFSLFSWALLGHVSFIADFTSTTRWASSLSFQVLPV
jgi:hypothetical protein